MDDPYVAPKADHRRTSIRSAWSSSTLVPLALAAAWSAFALTVWFVGGVGAAVLLGLWLLGAVVPLGVGAADFFTRRHERR